MAFLLARASAVSQAVDPKESGAGLTSHMPEGSTKPGGGLTGAGYAGKSMRIQHLLVSFLSCGELKLTT